MQGNALPFAKGHGTGNDFVIVPDPDGELNLPSRVVAALCDRRRGIGGDGLLRVVRTAAVAEVAGLPGAPEWFMDYRNADGTLARMCGNGVRVYARYLVQAGLAAGPSVAILTRAGPVVATLGVAAPGETAPGEAETGAAGRGEDIVAVDMPRPELLGTGTALLGGVGHAGTVVTCGNPNLVCRVTDPATLDLTGAAATEATTGVGTGVVVLDPVTFPAGANVEFVASAGDLWVRMRVVERGVGETLSCGSGACAAAAVVLRDAGRVEGTVIVDVPGGRLTVTIEEGRCVLAGPAVIVATGTLSFAALPLDVRSLTVTAPR